jgi:predicted glycogen debranching enzyme
VNEPLRVLRWPKDADPESLLSREWLVTNGLGGYASGTVTGALTRRYHGYLVAALPGPHGRTLMLNHLSERLRLPDGTSVLIAGSEVSTGLRLHGQEHFEELRLEAGLPVWRYRFGELVLEKRILMPHMLNTVHIHYRLLAGEGTVRLKIRPAVNFRGHEEPVSHLLAEPFSFTAEGDRYELADATDLPPLRLTLHGARTAFTLQRERMRELLYRIEENRGYESVGDLWSPGFFRVDLAPDQDVTLVASTEPWDRIEALSPEQAMEAEERRRGQLVANAHPAVRAGVGAELVLAADQFVVTPTTRSEEGVRARAGGDEPRTVIAGYHWFTDWGRDTMISLEGLTLLTGRQAEAGQILRTFAHAVRDGLIPNLYPEGESEGLYHTADATLWFFHALDRYVSWSGDRATLRLLLPTLADIVRLHVEGTRFGIGVDREDGLLRQGAEGYQLTWMDAKVGDWVVTPRRGKAVEINALWYNALSLLDRWSQEEGVENAPAADALARQTRESFNRRFWYEAGGYLYDVVDGEEGDDDACRPNQLLAISLPHPVLDRERWGSVVEVVGERLVTPAGLRSLDPGHPRFEPVYFGDLRARDAAYHQGTVWAWLIGPWVDAWLALHPEDLDGARRFLEPLAEHLGDACVGTLSEIFDAVEPFTPRGCVAQAWSVAELLRCWVRTQPKEER